MRVNLVDAPDQSSEREEELAWLKELPNGGARVVERGDLLRAAGHEAAQEHTTTEPPQAPGSQDSVRDDDDGDVPLVAGMSAAGDSADSDNVDWLDGLGSDVGEAAAADEPQIIR